MPFKDFVGNEVVDGDTIVTTNPYFPTKWVTAKVRNVSGDLFAVYTDSKNREVVIGLAHRGQFVKEVKESV